MKILACRTAWLETYTSFNEEPFGGHRYIQDNEGLAHESLNFLKDENTDKYYIYLPHNASGGAAKININRLGAKTKDEYIDGITVVLVAPHPIRKKLVITGICYNSRVYRDRKIKRPSNISEDIYVNVVSSIIYSIPPEDRVFSLPRVNEPGEAYGFGQSAIWYGLSSQTVPAELANLQKKLTDFIQILPTFLNNGNDNQNTHEYDATDVRIVKFSERIERRSDVRKFISIKGYKCEACDREANPESKKDSIWLSSFEVHHKYPIAALEVGKARKLKKEDVAVLCACCHRAIHRYGRLDDIAAFKRDCIKK